MKITGEAVNAAACALADEMQSEYLPETWAGIARKALEAAASHIAADAWDAAIDAAYERCVIGGITAEELKEVNPYRDAP